MCAPVFAVGNSPGIMLVVPRGLESAMIEQERPGELSTRIKEVLAGIERQESLMRRMREELEQLTHDLSEILRQRRDPQKKPNSSKSQTNGRN